MNWSTLLKLILVVGLIALIASSFSKPSEHQMEHPNNDPFKKQWAKIDSLSEDGLFNKALTATEALINEIRGTEYTDELVAALMYQYTFTTSLKEEGQAKALQQLETEIDLADQPVKSILQSLAAEKYANFRDRNRWKLQDRTVSAGVDNSDLLTWSLEDFATKVSELYLGSVSDPQAIKISSDEFPRILRTFEETKVLRPSLYDFLANRALDYFKSGYNYLSAPAYKFEITDPNALKGYQTFEAIQWDTRDSQSLDLKALQLYQDLIRFHQNDEDPSALIHTDLARLQYVHEHSFDTEKDAQYLETLEAYKTEFKSNPQVAEVIYLIADYWRNQGNKYQPGPSDAYRYDLKKAYDLCGEAIEKFPDSYGAKQCESLRADILQKKLSVQMEKVNPAKADMLARIDFKNMTQAYLRIIRHSDRLEKELNNAYWNERSKILANEDPIRSWSINLPDTEDHQNHATESIIENLPFGRYYIFVSDNQDFKQEGGATGYTDFHVSNLSLINRQVDGKEQFYVLDRVSGHPVKAVKAEIFVNKYNSLRRRYNKVLIATTNSDSDGKLTRTLVTREGFTIKLTKDKDILSLGDNFYEYNPGTPKPYTRTYFFQDRSIYRPGQTVYWKILMVDYDIEGNPTIKKNYSTTIYFYDTNGQVAEELAVKTNSYGTANGSFITPSNGSYKRMDPNKPLLGV
ncbi:MAG: MG2 domain-containing protein, partial [Bacteroidota bacterium]